MNHIEDAMQLLGGYAATARLLKKADGENPTMWATRKWAKAGKLPRTEATGETNYAEQMASLNPKIKKSRLLETVFVTKKAA